MKKFKIGIDKIQNIYLSANGDELRIFDESNDGVIECSIGNLRKTIRIITEAYENRDDLQRDVYGHARKAIQLGYYQNSIGKRVFRGNYIIISHIPAIIKMLKSVKIDKEKYVLSDDNLIKLSINDLENLKHIMKRRKRVLTDDNGYKYIEV